MGSEIAAGDSAAEATAGARPPPASTDRPGQASGCPYTPEDFRLDDPSIQADPYAFYPLLREERPVLRTTVGEQPWWVLSRQEDVVSALMDPETFSSRTLPDAALLFSDPPEHTRLRAMVAPWFFRSSINELAASIELEAEALIGRVAAAGRCDVVEDVAVKLTVTMISGMLGIPAQAVQELLDSRRYSGLFLAFLQAGRRGVEPSPEARAGYDKINGVLGGIVDGEHREGGLLADLVTQLRQGELTREQCMAYVNILFGAGHSTTTDLIGNTAYVLTGRPGDLDRIAQDQAFASPFIEEVLRTRPSFHRIPRITTREVEIGGETIPAGALVRLLLASANRDPAFCEEPETFDPDKKRRMHLAFGKGIHTCLGNSLARLEATIALQVMSRHVSAVSLDPSDPPSPREGGTFNGFGFSRLPVLLQARAA